MNPGGLFMRVNVCLPLIALSLRSPRTGTARSVPVSRTTRTAGSMSRTPRMPWTMSMPVSVSGISVATRISRIKRRVRIEWIIRWIVWIRIERVSGEEPWNTKACLGLKASFRMMTQAMHLFLPDRYLILCGSGEEGHISS